MCVSANERYCPTPPHPSVALRMCGSCRRTCSGVASRMCVSANERYCPTPPHPSVASRMCGSCRRTCSGVASRMCGSCRRTGSGVASRMCVSANERYCPSIPTPPHPIKIYVFCWTVKSPSAQSRLHTDAFTQTLLHRDSFTHTQTLLHTNLFAHSDFYTRFARKGCHRTIQTRKKKRSF